MVGEHFSKQMVVLMLDDACQKTGELLLMGLEILVDPFERYVLHTFHVLGEARQGQTSLAA